MVVNVVLYSYGSEMSVDTRPINQTETDKAQPEWATTSHWKDSHMHVAEGMSS
jgi:hypothetical protein